jgi:hypothetical protein
MKPEPQDLEWRLRAATARQAGDLDADSAALRESFLILGQRLEDATTVRDELRLLAALRDAQPSATVIAKKGADGRSHRALPMLVFLATLAAAVLVSASLAWNVFLGNAVIEHPIAQPITRAEPEPDSPLAEETSSADEGLLAWDDSLEETFVSTQWRVQRAGSLASSADAEVDTLYERIQSAAEELDPASL